MDDVQSAFVFLFLLDALILPAPRLGSRSSRSLLFPFWLLLGCLLGCIRGGLGRGPGGMPGRSLGVGGNLLL